MNSRKYLMGLLSIMASLGAASGTFGQSRVELDQRLKAVEKKLKQMESPSAPASTPTPAPAVKVDLLTSERGGLVLNAPSGGYSLKLGGFVEVDGRLFAGGARTFTANTLLVRRARLDLQPSFDKKVGFRVLGEFAGTSATLKDGFVWVKILPSLQVQAGKFKPPSSLDRLQSDPDQVFIEKSLAALLTPDRDLGLMVSGKLGDFGSGAIDISNGSPDNGNLDTDTENSKTWTARVFLTPFAKTGSFFEGLGLGISGTIGTENGSTPSGVTSGQMTFFSFRSTVKTLGERYRVIPQGYFFWGPLGVMGEYVQSSYGLVNGPTGTVTQRAWVGTASFVFGGKAAYGGALPDKPFDLSKGQLGALEAGLRASGLDLDPAAFATFADPNMSAQKALSLGVACNWAPEPRFKMSLNWEWTEFKGGATASGDRLPEEVFLARIQSFF